MMRNCYDYYSHLRTFHGGYSPIFPKFWVAGGVRPVFGGCVAGGRGMSAELRAGYKQTEVWVIPEDWSHTPIDQFATPVRGGSPCPAGDSRYFNGSFIPWLTVASLTNISDSQLVVSETSTCLTDEGELHSRTLNAGTLIIANSGATLGVAKILGMRCCANDGIAALLNLDMNVSARYIAHFINTKISYLRDVVATGNRQPRPCSESQ